MWDIQNNGKKIPINIFFSILSALMITITTPLYGQELPSNILTVQQLEDYKSQADQNVETKDNNLPVSKTTKKQNIRDLKQLV